MPRFARSDIVSSKKDPAVSQPPPAVSVGARRAMRELKSKLAGQVRHALITGGGTFATLIQCLCPFAPQPRPRVFAERKKLNDSETS